MRKSKWPLMAWVSPLVSFVQAELLEQVADRPSLLGVMTGSFRYGAPDGGRYPHASGLGCLVCAPDLV